MRIAFYAGSCLPIHARTLDERPLGGTETALIRLAESLHSRGHEVIVFTSHNSPPVTQPRYFPERQVFQHGMFDVFVLVKDWHPAVMGVPGRRRFFWTGDGWDQYVNFGMGDPRVVSQIDAFLAVSEWQASTLCERSGFPASKTCVISNGVYLPYFGGNERRVRKRLIYSSAPYRGLALLPKIFAEITRRHPESELHVFAGMSIYDTEKPFQGAEVAQFERLRKQLLQVPGCTVHGNVNQRELAREFKKSAVFVYPNTVFETCCISALEAQAAGCPIVASDNSALPETVAGSGILIPGRPGDDDYAQSFVMAVDSLLSDDELWQKYSTAGLDKIKATGSWEHVADRFEALL